jgi:hypothetical protein
VFTGIFAIEIIIKITAYGKGYFRDGWNAFDFVIVILSVVGIFIS